MIAERLVWSVVVAALAVTTVFLRQENRALKHAFLAGPDEKELVARSEALITKEQGVPANEVDKYFYKSYALFEKEMCIRFVPKAGVLGGATSYCYTLTKPNTLVRVDKAAG